MSPYGSPPWRRRFDETVSPTPDGERLAAYGYPGETDVPPEPPEPPKTSGGKILPRKPRARRD